MQNLIKKFLRAWLLASLLTQVELATAEAPLLLEDAVALAVAGQSRSGKNHRPGAGAGRGAVTGWHTS